MKIYISGKIGEEVISQETAEKFARAEKMLEGLKDGKGRRMFKEVFNPADPSWQRAMGEAYNSYLDAGFSVMDKYTYVLMQDIKRLAKYDAIYLLEDYDDSPGATAEYHFALATGKKMFFQEEIDAHEYMVDEYLCIRKSQLRGGELPIERDIEQMHRYVDKNVSRVWLPINEDTA